MNNTLNHWQRLSPLSVMFFIGKSMLRLIKDALPTFAPMLVIVLASDKKLTMTLALGAGLALLIIGGAILQFWFFKFRQQHDQVLINDGVFKKNHRVIRFDRVQNVNILTPVYFRPFGLVTLQIETAGSKGNEADLAGIPATTAATLRTEILQYQQVVSSQNNDNCATVPSEESSTLVATASLKDLVAYGVSSNGVFFFLAIIGPLLGLFFSSFEGFFRIFIRQTIMPVMQFLGDGPGGKVGASLVMITVIILLMFLFSILGAIYRYYGYKLSLQQAALKRRSGLLTRFEESVKIVKVQTFITQSNFIGRWIQRQNITLGQVASSQAGHGSKRNVFIIPARKPTQIPALRKLVFADSPDDLPEQPIDRRYILKTWLIWFVVPMMIVAIYYLSQQEYRSAGIAGIFALAMLPLVIKRWSMFRFGHSQNHGVFKTGLFGFKRTLFPLYKVQHTVIMQSPLQRRQNLTTLKISLAAGEIVIPYITMQQANMFRERIRNEIKTNQSPWY